MNFMNKLNITWKDILDNKTVFIDYQTINKFMKLVVQTGYKYFSWNGRVYEVSPDHNFYKDTGLMTKDI